MMAFKTISDLVTLCSSVLYQEYLLFATVLFIVQNAS